MFERLRRALPRVRTAARNFVREVLEGAPDPERDANDRLALAAKLSQVYYYRFELSDGDIANAKATFVNIWESLGYATPPPVETFGEALGMVVLQEDQAQAARDVHAALSGEAPSFQSEYRIRHADGSIHWNFARGIVLRDAAGRPTELIGTSIDTTDLKRVQQRIELAIVGSKTAIWDVEVDAAEPLASKIHFTNVAEILGYDGTDFPSTWGAGMPLFHADDRDGMFASIMELFSSERREWEHRVRLVHRNGTAMWFLMRGVVSRDSAGAPVRFTGVSIEVTEREQLAAELQLAKDRLELGLRSSGLGLFDIAFPNSTAPGRRVAINVLEPLGYDPGDGDVAAEMLLLAEDRPALQAHLQAYLAGEVENYEIELRHRHCDGSIRWKLARGLAIRDVTGKPVRLVGCLVDITERKEVEDRLREAEERFRRTFENAAVGMAITDGEATFLACNDMLYQFYGYPPDELAQLRFAELSVDPAHVEAEKFRLVVSGALDRFSIDKRYRRKDGQIVWGNATVSAVLRDEVGRATQMLGVIQDITERKTLELELDAAREAAEAANRAKDQFLAHVSHEIRTPLNAIMGMTELALDSTGEHQRQLLRTARAAAGNLLEIINDLLDFSKIEAGKLTLHVATFSLRTMIAEVVQSLAPRAEAKSLALHHAIDGDTPDVLAGDEGRLRQILVNLLGNAIKFTPKGEARLEIRTVEQLSGHAMLAFEVRDTGIGIAPDKQDLIFRAFEQGDLSTTRKYGGTGLGLTISAQLAELMGGGIAVESEVGRGSCFVLTVPFTLGDPATLAERRVESPALEARKQVRPRVLVAEDNELNVAVVREFLKQRGYRADYAENGRAALELLERGHHDLLLLDLHMPELDGFEVVHAIRARERASERHLPIIALTARSAQKDREEALAAGMDEFMSKPIDVTALWAAVDRLLAAHPPAPRPESLLDRDTIVRVSGGRAEAFTRLVDVFRSTLPGQMARGHTAFEDHDFGRLRDAAHRLHGTLAAFSTIAGAVALDLEDASTRAEMSRCRELLGALDEMSGQLLEATRTLHFDDLARL